MYGIIQTFFVFYLETCPAYSAKYFRATVRAMALTSQKKIDFPGSFHLWQHLVPKIGQKHKNLSNAKRKTPLNSVEFLMA
jgi:hypothetical protein